MIQELKSYRFTCDWESDNAGCDAHFDMMADEAAEGVARLIHHHGWLFVANTLFCPDCKDSSMVDNLQKDRAGEK